MVLGARFALYSVSACLTLVSGVAAADTGMLPGGATLNWPFLYIRDANDELIQPPDPETLRTRLNAASCACSKQNMGSTDLYYELQLTATTGVSPIGELWVGSQCDDDIARPMQCRKVGDVGDLDALAARVDNFPVRLFDLINAAPTAVDMDCRAANNGEAFVWVISDTDVNADPDFFSPRPLDLDLFQDVNGFDTLAPPQLESLDATGSESSVEITWEIPLGNADDFFAFHALCMDAEGNPVKEPGEPLYSTTQEICGIEQTFDLTPATIDSPDGTDVTALPVPFASLDPAYICGTVENGTATSLRVEGLENEQPYTVAIVAVDFYGNPSGAFFTRTVVPKPVTDFWEDLHDRGSQVEGGFCSTSGGSSGGALGALGLVVVALGLVLGSSRRRRRVGPLAATVLVTTALAAPRLAAADDFTPYWEDPASDEVGAADEGAKWHVGIKLGPYTPAIDDQVGVNPTTGMGPYQAMFGNYYTLDAGGNLVANDAHVYQVLPTLDVDRYVWTLTGKLAVGGTIGYMRKSAFAYLEGDGEMFSADNPFRPRSTAAKNTFHLIPMALTATYRLTQLDDFYGIPVVPYIKGGLAYYIWWLKGPGGDVAKICTDGTTDSDCDGNKAYGGSLGVQGSLGVAIRAERIDSDAARSMVNSGIYHAGFYLEYMFAKVDGFGSEKKLSVGDATWFAGVDFEF